MLLERYKTKLILHEIVTGDVKWIYCGNNKRKKSYVKPLYQIAVLQTYRSQSCLCIKNVFTLTSNLQEICHRVLFETAL